MSADSPRAAADPTRAFVRHTIATLAYRGSKILRNAPASFADARAGDPSTGTRSAVEILAHIGDLFDWMALIAAGEKGWRVSPPQSWDHEVGRFYDGLRRIDAAIVAESTPTYSWERTFQGPIADAFTHLGQLALLRRIAESPIRGETMVLAEVVTGRVGPEQTPPVREFD